MLSTPYEGLITAGYDGGLAGAPLRPGSADAVDGDRLGIEAGHGGVARLRSTEASPPRPWDVNAAAVLDSGKRKP